MTDNQPILAKPIAFLKRDFKIATSYRLNFITQGFGVFLTTCSFFLVSKMFSGQDVSFLEPYGGNYFAFVLIGISLTDYLTVSTSAFASEIRSAQIVGTLESLLVTPTSLNTILFSSFTYKLLSTSFRTTLYFLLGIFVFGIKFGTVNFFLLALIFFLTLVPFLGLGLLSAAFIIIFKQGSPIPTLMAMSSGLLSGVLYPVTVLPSWAKPLSTLLPTTHGLEAMRQVLLQDAIFADISNHLVNLSIFSVILLGIGIYSIHKALNIAKQEGSLLQY